MSADSEIANILSYATAATSSLASQSSALVSAAVGALEGTIEFPTWDPSFGSSIGVDVPDPSGTLVTVPGFAGTRWVPAPKNPEDPPTAFPAWPTLTFADAPDTQELDEVYDTIKAEFPTLTLPTFTGYPTVGSVPAFTRTAPTISTAVTLPPRPDTDVGYEMELQDIDDVPDPGTIKVAAPTLMDVTTTIDTAGLAAVYPVALSQFMGAIEGAMEPLLAESAAWSNRMLDAVLDVALAALSARLTDSTAPVMSTAAHQELTDRLLARLETERLRVEALVIEDRSGWNLPAAVRQAMRDTIEQIQQTQFQTTEAGFYTKTIELALALFEVYGDLLAKFSTGTASLYGKVIELTFETHRASLAAAQKTVTSLLKLHELVYVTLQDLQLAVAEAKVGVAEAELTAAMVTFEVAKLKVEVEQAKQERDDALIKVLQAEAKEQEVKVRVHAADVSATRAQLEAVKLPTDLFVLKVKVFEARIGALQAQVEARVAEVENDTAKLEAKLLVVKEYETQAASFDKIIASKSQISQSQAARNAAVLEEFEARVKGVLAPLEQTALTDEYELQKYSVLAEDVLADARIAERNDRARLRFAMSKQDGNRDAYQFTLERAINLMKAELDRAETIASANETGAGIMANMALSAMSSANAVAHTIITESE